MSEKFDKPEEGSGGAEKPPGEGSLSRRSFLQGMGLAAGAAAVPLNMPTGAEAATKGGIGPGAVPIRLKVNGSAMTVTAQPRTTLAEALRDELDLTGTKVVCDRGACGACTVMLDGESICACSMLALDAQGKEIVTIEGLAKPDGTLDPVQAGFVEHDGQQCGFCTPGMIMRSRAFLNENPNPTLREVQDGLAGNTCRCGAYSHIFAAVLSASGKEA